jgi:hypothetical protein
MLSKYDEEEEDAGFQIRAGAVVADQKARQAAEERRKLAESECNPLYNGRNVSVHVDHLLLTSALGHAFRFAGV